MCRTNTAGTNFLVLAAISSNSQCLVFCRHHMVAMPAAHMSKQNIAPSAIATTFETNLSFLEVPYFLLHNRQTLFQRWFAGVGRNYLILLFHTKRRHLVNQQLTHDHVLSHSQQHRATGTFYIAYADGTVPFYASVAVSADEQRPAGQNPARQAFPSGPRSLYAACWQSTTWVLWISCQTDW